MLDLPIFQRVLKTVQRLLLFYKTNAAFDYLDKIRFTIKTTQPYIFLRYLLKTKRNGYLLGIVLDVLLVTFVVVNGIKPAARLISPLLEPLIPLHSLKEGKGGYEVMGFAPHWTFHKLDNVDFNVLTTLAYFGVDVDEAGNLVKEGPGYETFMSERATRIFRKAHENGTRVVLTITQMKNGPIKALMDSEGAQQKAIEEIVTLVKNRGLDGVNVDMEYGGDPGKKYRDKFSQFVVHLSSRLHQEVPASKLTVSVYAASVKDPKIFDIASLAQSADGIFMMAYDFAVAGSDNAMPTAPLYGYKEGKYWYDISTAVEDFLKVVPEKKLVLGVPYYGYNYLVYKPEVKAETRPYWSWRGTPKAQTYSIVQNDVPSQLTGWDNLGQVGWKAYFDEEGETWRMVFADDPKSLSIKYDFAKNKKLAGVGMWALGFDDGKRELWDLLAEKFGNKLADNSHKQKYVR